MDRRADHDHARQRDPDILDADQVAEMLGLNRKTVYEAVHKGQLPCRRIGRRLVFFRPALVAWLSHAARPRHSGEENISDARLP